MCFAGKGSSWIQEHITGCNSFKGVTSRMVFRGCCGKYVHFWQIHFWEIHLVLLHKAQLQEWCLGSVGSYITGLSHRPATFCLFCRQTVRVLVWGLNCGYLRDHLPLRLLIFSFLHTLHFLQNFEPFVLQQLSSFSIFTTTLVAVTLVVACRANYRHPMSLLLIPTDWSYLSGSSSNPIQPHF